MCIRDRREGVKAKPDPSIVNEIVERASISKEYALYVGDSDVDMQTAINSEVTSCGVTWGFRPRTELEKYAPDHIAEKACLLYTSQIQHQIRIIPDDRRIFLPLFRIGRRFHQQTGETYDRI